MKHSFWTLDVFAENKSGMANWLKTDAPDPRRRHLLALIKQALPRELTPRQKQCVQLYYYDNKNIYEIAKLLNIYPSTVCRHLKKARARLFAVLQYYFDPLSKQNSGQS